MANAVTVDRRVVRPLDNNAWIIGDDSEVLVIDPAHEPETVAEAVAGRTVKAIVLTHGHFDHVGRAREFGALVSAPVHLHPADIDIWRESYPNDEPDRDLADGDLFEVGGIEVQALHTPGHTPGSTCLWMPELATVFTGDTLFEGGPGATRWPYSSFETIIDSIRERLFTLEPETVVNTGHGPSTTIGAEAGQLTAWLSRGW